MGASIVLRMKCALEVVATCRGSRSQNTATVDSLEEGEANDSNAIRLGGGGRCGTPRLPCSGSARTSRAIFQVIRADNIRRCVRRDADYGNGGVKRSWGCRKRQLK